MSTVYSQTVQLRNLCINSYTIFSVCVCVCVCVRVYKMTNQTG